MTDKPEYEQDNKPSNTPCPSCGKPTKVHMNVPTGKGRVFCPCGWNDRQTSSSTVNGPTRGGKPSRGVREVSMRIHTTQGQQGVRTITKRGEDVR